MRLKTERLVIEPFDMKYLRDYAREFNAQITRYQYPEPFESEEAASEVLGGFMAEMENGDMLLLALLAHDGEFIGSAEVHGLREEHPELGIWLKQSAQGRGYAFEALSAVLAALDSELGKAYYIYEADERNTASIRLVKRFEHTVGELDELETESGKLLRLRTYYVRVQRSADDCD